MAEQAARVDTAPERASAHGTAGAGSTLPSPHEPGSELSEQGRVPVSLGLGALGVGLAALLAPGDPLPLPLDVRWCAAFALFVALPGWLLARVLLPGRRGVHLDGVLLAFGAGYSIAILLGLALHALFRPIAPWQIALGGGLVVVALALAAARRAAGVPAATLVGVQPLRAQPQRRMGWLARRIVTGWPVLLIFVVAAPLRLTSLGWSEFQGDEARVLLRAMAALQGAEGALAAHRKVPGEILLAYLFAGSLGQTVEHLARLPYALAGVGAVLAFYSLARKLMGGPAALVAGLLLAVNGYFVAFGRILQYDSLAFFLGITGLLCCWRFGRGRAWEWEWDPGATSEDLPNPGVTPATAGDDGMPPRYLSSPESVPWALLGALLLSGAALVALGAIFLVPPALLLAWPGLVRHGRSWRVLAAWAWPVVPGVLAAVLVFSESGSGEGPSTVWSYLGPRLGGGAPYWNAEALLRSANHYLSSPYLLVMLVCGVFALALGVISSATVPAGRGAVIRLSLAVVVAAVSWSNPRLALALGVLLAVALAVHAPAHKLGHFLGPPLGMRVGLLWAAIPLFAHLFLIRVPGTHFREAFPGLILIVAGLVAPALLQPRARLLVSGLFAVLIIGSGHYSWVTLVQRAPEYQITYPANRHPLDWSERDGRRIGGVYGAVHRHGWKALGVLVADGTLAGSYATNESPGIAAWYIRQPQGCAGSPDLVFRAPTTPHDRNLAVPVRPPPNYRTGGRVRVDGRSTIAVQQPPAVASSVGTISAEEYTTRFDRELSSVWRPVGELYRADQGAAAARRNCTAPRADGFLPGDPTCRSRCGGPPPTARRGREEQGRGRYDHEIALAEHAAPVKDPLQRRRVLPLRAAALSRLRILDAHADALLSDHAS